MSERMKFVLRLQDGERMSDLCKEFGISRKTGYKLWNRFNEDGAEAFTDRSRKPKKPGNQTDPRIEHLILELKKERPTWGAPKILEYLKRKHPTLQFPARSTVHAILDRNELVKKRKRPKFKSTGTNLKPTFNPNDLWCVDYKGEFKLGNKKYCYPLTITDQHSRYIICCESLESTKAEQAIPVFKEIFHEYGLPHAIRSDNGAPFSSNNYYGLSRLSILWLKLGIKIERIRPGNPQENGRHERMHRTLKEETTKPPAENHLAQQEKFDKFVLGFNNDRPHEALEMKTPNEIYKMPNTKFNHDKLNLAYPDHDRTHRVSLNGSFEPQKGHYIYLGAPFAYEDVGTKEVDEQLIKITFANYDVGYYDFQEKKLQRVPILEKLT